MIVPQTGHMIVLFNPFFFIKRLKAMPQSRKDKAMIDETRVDMVPRFLYPIFS